MSKHNFDGIEEEAKEYKLLKPVVLDNLNNLENITSIFDGPIFDKYWTAIHHFKQALEDLDYDLGIKDPDADYREYLEGQNGF